MRKAFIAFKLLGIASFLGSIAFVAIASYMIAHARILMVDMDVDLNAFGAICAGIFGIAGIAAIIGVLFLKAEKVKKKAIPFAIVCIIFFVIAPIAGITMMESLYNQGESDLAKIETLYSNQSEWEARASTIRQGILIGSELVPLPTRTPLNATIHSKRVYSNYSVENVFFESLPGFFVSGNLFRSTDPGGPKPVILIPHGHFPGGRFAEHNQQLGATLARMGAIVITYDMVGWGESTQVDHGEHYVLAFQLWNSMRVLDFLLSLPDADPSRVAITGASGGGTQTLLLAAVDARVNISAPVVMVSSWFYGSCTCEVDMPLRKGAGYETNNAEIAALPAPNPLLLVSDGRDWTRDTPTLEYPFIQRIYQFYGMQDRVENAHFLSEGHDYGPSKRNATYHFFAKCLNLSLGNVTYPNGTVNEAANIIEDESAMHAFTSEHPRPTWALHGEGEVLHVMRELQGKADVDESIPGYPIEWLCGMIAVISIPLVGKHCLDLYEQNRRVKKGIDENRRGNLKFK
nr:acetylxylan esterase [Candidatus Sigynarchaeota archaeon]